MISYGTRLTVPMACCRVNLLRGQLLGRAFLSRQNFSRNGEASFDTGM